VSLRSVASLRSIFFAFSYFLVRLPDTIFPVPVAFHPSLFLVTVVNFLGDICPSLRVTGSPFHNVLFSFLSWPLSFPPLSLCVPSSPLPVCILASELLYFLRIMSCLFVQFDFFVPHLFVPLRYVFFPISHPCVHWIVWPQSSFHLPGLDFSLPPPPYFPALLSLPCMLSHPPLDT